jgi:hypothetical protein
MLRHRLETNDGTANNLHRRRSALFDLAQSLQQRLPGAECDAGRGNLCTRAVSITAAIRLFTYAPCDAYQCSQPTFLLTFDKPAAALSNRAEQLKQLAGAAL